MQFIRFQIKTIIFGFLNALFHGTHIITDLTYINGEQLGIRKEDRRAIFDVYCETESGEKYIVEMQNVFQQFFKDRSVYYSTFPIREQSKRGDWNYRLESVYTIGILNFVFDEDKNSKEYFHHEVKLMDVNTKKVFYDKLTFIYLELNTARTEGLEQGLEKGHEEEKMEIARKMKSDGLPDDIISKYTGLLIEKLKRI
ncbi:PD-(D/E)XK nuclease family transposase [uncultured Bacteroides sp.]|uniref:PD-(D/E)XK nuclease family transposase n=1 Tax=uncultured Bacteroides sp. TaxID=162156 RepID=UPI00280BF819|nr:PD-(D/E)XK nuclease family transposase [uncultured Bacteroides sp.]